MQTHVHMQTCMHTETHQDTCAHADRIAHRHVHTDMHVCAGVHKDTHVCACRLSCIWTLHVCTCTFTCPQTPMHSPRPGGTHAHAHMKAHRHVCAHRLLRLVRVQHNCQSFLLLPEKHRPSPIRGCQGLPWRFQGDGGGGLRRGGGHAPPTASQGLPHRKPPARAGVPQGGCSGLLTCRLRTPITPLPQQQKQEPEG